MPNTLQVVVFRASPDERTCAVLRCAWTPTVRDDATLRATLTRALTRWFQETADGRQALAASDDDFHVGDLAENYRDKTLLPYLNQEGITNLTVETYQSDATNWSYDQHLVNAPGGEDDR